MIIGIGVMSYYLAVYLLLPQYLPSLDSIMLQNLLNLENIYGNALSLGPVLAGVLAFSASILVDKLMKGKHPAEAQMSAQASAPAMEPLAASAAGSVNPSPSVAQEQQKPVPVESGPSAEKVAEMVEEIVSGKVTEMTNEVTIFKKDAAAMKDDVEKVKKNIEALTTSLESSLTDMKAFQAEMVNPLNFMRKYFETMDIKSLSDPTQGLPPIMPLSADKGSPAVTIAEESSESKRDVAKAEPPSMPENAPADKNKGPGDIAHAISMKTVVPSNRLHVDVEKQDSPTEEGGSAVPQDIGELLDGKLTLGKMMAMAPVLEKILRDMGTEGVDAMVDQYRLLGLKPEEERAMYNLVFMLKNFNLSSDEVVSKLYRLGQVMGIQDPQADLEYSKMQAGKRTSAQKASTGRTGASSSTKTTIPGASNVAVKSTPVSVKREV